MQEFPHAFPQVTLPWVDPDRPNLAWEARPLQTVRLLTTTPRVSGKNGGAMNGTYFDDRLWKPALLEVGVIGPPETEVVRRPGKSPLKRVRWNMLREEGFHVVCVDRAPGRGEHHATGGVARAVGPSVHAADLRALHAEVGSRGLQALGEWVAPGAAGEVEGPDAVGSPRILPERKIIRG
ncbi:hypothetical protein [Streptomyces longwoodensis]|uniref:hypothetical protein n=1 Tax=Streptomyces longwoodensis TaxID=68231 RepID=UPI00384AFD82